MNGLRIYIDLKRPDALCSVFYTKRAGGPYYRWRYEELRGRWLGSRLRPVELPTIELGATPWKGVPTALKSTLNEHYID